MSDEQQPFIQLPTEEQLRAHMKPEMKTPYDFGFIGGMSRLVAAHQRIGAALRAFFGEVMFAPGALTRAEREMVAAVASAAQDCEY
jgi:alkylhydroperoxidase/carboxymuconolactone decarboxylase family protein YurZ